MPSTNRTQGFLSIVIIISMISIALLSWQLLAPAGQLAEHGVLDLRQDLLAGDRAVRLNGMWEFYPDQLLGPQDFRGMAGQAVWQKVPSSWSKYDKDIGWADSEFAAATYRLKVLVPEGFARYGIKTTSIHANARVFANGQEIIVCGEPGYTRETSALKYYPETGYFEMASGELEIIVQASSNISVASGITQPIFFGSITAIKKLRARQVLFDAANATMLLVIFIYLLATATQHGEKRERIVLALFCLCSALKAAMQNEILLNAFVELPYEVFIALGAIVMVGQFYLLIKYTRLAFGMPKFSRFSVEGLLLAGLLVGGFLVRSLAKYRLEQFFLLSTAITLGLMFYIVRRYSDKRRVGNDLLRAIGVCISTIIVANVFAFTHEPHFLILPLEMLLLLTLALYTMAQYNESNRVLLGLNERLMESDRLKNDFLAKTSHELIIPLNNIINLTQSVLKSGYGGAQKENVLLVSRVSKRLSLQVHNLLDYTRLLHRDIELEIETIDLYAVANYTVEIFQHLTRGRNLIIENLIPPQTLLAQADKMRVQQVLTNLLDNAAKFTTEGSITIRGWEAKGLIYVSVSDTGMGIARHEQVSLFQPYEERTQGTSPGPGLGLQISRQLIELQGGTIGVHSEAGAGSCFTFTLPQTAEAPVAASRQAAAGLADLPISNVTYIEANKGGRHLVLVVDGNYASLKELSNMLVEDDYHVIAVADARQAMQMLEGPLNFDLCILDLMMPSMPGYELCRKIRQRFEPLDLPVLLLTTNPRPEEIEVGFQAGANDFLKHPFDPTELLARVNNLVHMRRAKEILLAQETAFLQAQIKPHFLFNALNTITSFQHTAPAQAAKLLMELNVFLRHSFDFESTSSFITVKRELRLVEAYVAIEQARFSSRVQVTYDIDPICIDYCILPLTIQPLVENAIRHGITQRNSGGQVNIEITCLTPDQLQITVSDDGVGFSTAAMQNLMRDTGKQKGVGLQNINKRLTSFYGQPLRIQSEPDQGTSITFTIPAQKDAD